ncbi:MAG: hypothetical protein AABY22_28780 [Nanoarchaeota archaeon]
MAAPSPAFPVLDLATLRDTNAVARADEDRAWQAYRDHRTACVPCWGRHPCPARDDLFATWRERNAAVETALLAAWTTALDGEVPA